MTFPGRPAHWPVANQSGVWFWILERIWEAIADWASGFRTFLGATGGLGSVLGTFAVVLGRFQPIFSFFMYCFPEFVSSFPFFFSFFLFIKFLKLFQIYEEFSTHEHFCSLRTTIQFMNIFFEFTNTFEYLNILEYMNIFWIHKHF